MAEEKKRARRSGDHARKPASGLLLIGVQSAACAVLLLISLLIRLAGGSAFGQLQAAFGQAIADNSVLATIAGLFETDPPAPAKESAVSSTTTTAAQTTKTTTASTAATSADTTSATAPTAAVAEVVAVAHTAASPPEGTSYRRLQTNLVARLPVDHGVLTSGYGYRDNPTGPGRQFHGGVDIAADAGAPIYAMYFGVVIDAGDSPSYGQYIRLYHGDGIEVLYAHCSAVSAEIGETVGAGDEVAKVGATGDATGNHLHVEVFREDTRYDPTGVVPVTAYV